MAEQAPQATAAHFDCLPSSVVKMFAGSFGEPKAKVALCEAACDEQRNEGDPESRISIHRASPKIGLEDSEKCCLTKLVIPSSTWPFRRRGGYPEFGAVTIALGRIISKELAIDISLLFERQC
jgi:hypothetical protein